MHLKYYIFFIGLLFVLAGSSQTKLTGGRVPNRDGFNETDSTGAKRAKGFDKLATIDMYLQFNEAHDSLMVDTTLTIRKDYKFNYLQKDNFGLMPFANMGQSYNTLTFNTSTHQLQPLFGAQARHFNYLEVDDINYYEVPTPWTRLTYKTAFEQGQLLDAFFTVNLSRQFNFSIAYKGLRSLGTYQNALTSSGNFRFTTNYKSKNKRYRAQAHMVTQDLMNQENGGLRDEDLENFTSGEEEFIDRSVFDLNFVDAENILEGRRFFLNHQYDLIQQSDSLSRNKLTVSNTVSFESKYFQFYQDTPAINYFGDVFTNDINDKTTLENFKTELGLNFVNNTIGELHFAVDYTNFNYGYNSVVLYPEETIPNRIKTSYLGLNAGYIKKLGLFQLNTKASINLSDEFKGSYIDAFLSLSLNEDLQLSGGINLSSRVPNYNFLLYQSDYLNYNWYHLNTFENINTQQLRFNINSKTYGNAEVDISNIANYTFFKLEETIDNVRIVKPSQYNSTLQYLRLKVQKEFKVGNFALDNTVMYQNVISDEAVLNVPDIITRNTLYYSNQLFKKSMILQTGVTLNYFTKYHMNRYDPLLAEFYTQNETELGGFPRLDFFINAKIRQTRIFLKAEHFNSAFTGYNYFSAPNHPFRDFTIRFGLVWDFFL